VGLQFLELASIKHRASTLSTEQWGRGSPETQQSIWGSQSEGQCSRAGLSECDGSDAAQVDGMASAARPRRTGGSPLVKHLGSAPNGGLLVTDCEVGGPFARASR